MIFHDSLILLISACIINKNLAKAEFIENKRAENWKKSSNRKCKILKINNGTLQTNGWTFDVDHKDFASLVIQTLPRESKLTFSYLNYAIFLHNFLTCRSLITTKSLEMSESWMPRRKQLGPDSLELQHVEMSWSYKWVLILNRRSKFKTSFVLA